MTSDGGFRELARSVHTDEFGVRIGEVTVTAPDGTPLRRRYLHTPDVVAVVAVDGDDLVLVREFRAAVGATVLALPMGKLTDGGAPRVQALAELAEETGLAAESCEPLARLLVCPGWMNQTMHVFLATGLRPVIGRLPLDGAIEDDIEEQHLAVVRLPLSRLNGAIAGGEVRDARTIAALHLALPRLSDVAV